MKVPDLDQYQDAETMRLHRIGWAWQKGFYVVLVLTLIAGLLGLFGGGLFSTQTLEIEPGITVTYERFARQDAENDIIIKLNAGPSSTPQTILLPENLYLLNKIDDVEPSPTVSYKSHAAEYDFGSYQGGKTVLFRLIPANAGLKTYALQVAGHSVEITQFIWP